MWLPCCEITMLSGYCVVRSLCCVFTVLSGCVITVLCVYRVVWLLC